MLARAVGFRRGGDFFLLTHNSHVIRMLKELLVAVSLFFKETSSFQITCENETEVLRLPEKHS